MRILSKLLFLLSFSFSLIASADVLKDQKPRLTIDSNKDFLLDGKKAYAHGINYPNAIVNLVSVSEESLPAIKNKYCADLDVFKKYDIPFFRAPLSGYWASTWQLYVTDSYEYFKRLDFLVEEAEKRNIGIIFTFLNSQFSIPDIKKEKVSEWGNRNSETRAFFKEFVREVVERYKNSSAIFAWEFAESFLDYCDIPGSENGLFPVNVQMGSPEARDAKDKITRKMIYPVREEFYKYIRSVDKVRPIFSGEKFPRRNAASNISGRWTIDTPQSRERMMMKDSDDFDAVSIHLFNNPDIIKLYGEKASFESLLEFSLKVAKKARKPLFVGEWGWSNDGVTYEYFFTDKAFSEALSAVEKLRPQLTAFWVYDLPYQPINSTSLAKNTYVLEALKKLNNQTESDSKTN